MAWIEVHQTLVRHRKTLRLAKELRINRHRAIGLIIDLWCWSIDNAPDGDLSRLTPSEISAALAWTGNAPSFLRSLRASGFLDADDHLHDWDEYAGRLIDKRNENAARMREIRTKKKGTQLEVVQ